MKDQMQQKFLSLYESQVDSLFRFVFFRVSDRERAKDIVQDAFLKMWQTIETGRKVENERAFLFRIAGNLVIDHYRKVKEYSLDSLAEEGFDAQVESSHPLETKIDADIALGLLQAIPEKYRDAVWLRKVEEWSVKDIAEMLSETEDVISVRIHRGLKIWRSLVEEQSCKKTPSQTL